MTSASLSLRIGAMFIIFVVSCIGFITPIRSKNENMDTPLRVCMKCCGAGVMLGIAMIHLIPDADGDLSEVYPDFPVAFVITSGGILLIVAIEQIAMIVASRAFANGHKDAPSKSVALENFNAPDAESGHHHKEDCGLKNCDCDPNETSPPSSPARVKSVELVACEDPDHSANCHVHVEHDHSHSYHHNDADKPPVEIHCAHDHDLGLAARLAQSGDSVRDIVMVYALELSIAIHSIIIGVDIGLLSRSSDMVTLITLIIAVSFHQYIEGFSVGVSIMAASDTLTREGGVSLVSTDNKVLMFLFIFSITVPLGIFIGILTSASAETEAGVVAKGCANALAAGSLVYISLAEMIGSDFNRPHLKARPMLRLAMLGSLTTGVLLTAVLAVWA